MRVRYFGNGAWAGVKHLAVALQGDHRQRHLGVLFVDPEDGQHSVFHLAWHIDAQCEPADDSWIWFESQLDDINAVLMAAWVKVVAEEYAHGRLAYGISYVGGRFETESGKWLDREGLTCATLVLALFESQGHSPLDRSTWASRADDVDWQQKVLSALAKHDGCDAEYLRLQRSKLGCLRFRPEEVAAGIALFPPASTFPCCVRLGSAVVGLLTGT